MKKLAIVFAAAALPLLAAAGHASAQKLEVGKWTGRVTPPAEEGVDVTYDVSMKGDTIAILANAGEHGSFPFNEVKLTDKTLTFWFTPGPRVDCSLTRRDDGAFEGPCKEVDGDEARMLMVPPKKQ